MYSPIYDMSTLLSLYIACTIFGVGVTLIDMVGVFGDLFQHVGWKDAKYGVAFGFHSFSPVNVSTVRD